MEEILFSVNRSSQKPSIVVLGCGFAAFSFLKKIDLKSYRVVLVSPRNHFLFTPLLPSSTVGTVEFRSIIEPVRVARPEIEFYQAACFDMDAESRTIRCRGVPEGREFSLVGDHLVIAVGAVSNTYGIPGVDRHALFLREASEARAIRIKIIDCFEKASMPGLDPGEKRRLLHFVVVGGGPTGVEFAAEMHDFLEQDLRNSFPQSADEFQITLLEATSQILNTFDARLGAYTLQLFKRQRIEVRLGIPVREVTDTTVFLADGTAIPCGLVVWSAGNGPSPLIESLPFEKDMSRRLVTDPFFRVKGMENIYALGDCAAIEGKNFPAAAQVAQQEGKYLAKMFNRKAGGKSIDPFSYRHMGMLAYIGSKRALADLPNVKAHGFAAYFFWRSAYLTRLVSLKNKILVLFDWIKTSLFGRDISRF